MTVDHSRFVENPKPNAFPCGEFLHSNRVEHRVGDRPAGTRLAMLISGRFLGYAVMLQSESGETSFAVSM